MTVGKVQASNGVFTITDASGKTQQVDLGTLMMMLNLDRTNNLDNQIAMQLEDIKKRNALISDYTAFMAECRSRKASGGSFDLSTITLPSGITATSLWQKEFSHAAWTQKTNDDKTKEASWEANINAIKGKIDMLNNDSQMDNIKLQNLLEKRNNAFEMATKVMDTNNQSIQSTIRNL